MMATATARIGAGGGDLIAIAFHRRLCGGSDGCQLAVNAGALRSGLRGRHHAADRMNLNWVMPAKGGSYAAVTFPQGLRHRISCRPPRPHALDRAVRR